MRLYFLKQCFLITFIWTLSMLAHALDSSVLEKQAQTSIEQLYHKLGVKPKLCIQERIDWFSAHYLGMPYELGSLGEGPNGRYDQYPLYRVDAFDCDTYVNTILALALAQSFTDFQRCLQLLRYDSAKISYLHRLHFTGLDWNRAHQQQKLLHDITPTLVDNNRQPVAEYATALIDKNQWYQMKDIDTIRKTSSKKEQKRRLEELKNKGRLIRTETEKVPYIPLNKLFIDGKKPDLKLFSQIPQGAIIEIVRPNWDLRAKIGTALNISHLGFAIWKGQVLYFRQASSERGKTVDIPLVSYLQKALSSPTIKGINIQTVIPTYPDDFKCGNSFHQSVD
ncbi:MAG: hypothetical protein BGO90_13700 [Legionella sp. 40-6]|nr:MAG: hypothetical protein BGO90_13700 [Legionella sp. 40-6]